MTKNVDRVLLKKSKRTTEGLPNLPLPEQMVEGELAMNYAKDVETLSLKNESGDVVTFSSDNYYTEKKLGDYFTGEEGSAKTVTDVILEKERVTAEAIIDLREVKADADDVLWEKGEDMTSVKLKDRGSQSANGGVCEGYSSQATGAYSHSEGYNTKATGAESHAEGNSARATESNSHAEGYYTMASGNSAHAEGYQTTASSYSHAEGSNTYAYGSYTHAEGYFTKAQNTSEHASGQYNISNRANIWSFGHSGNTLFSVGNGRSESMRQNALEIMQNGDIYVLSGETASDGSRARVLLQDGIGTVPTEQVLDETTSTSTNPVAAKAVYDAIVENEEIVSTVLTYLNDNKVGNVVYDSTENKINFYSSGTTSGNIISSIDVSEIVGGDSLWEAGTGQNSAILKGSSGTASGDYSVAEGYQTSGTGNYSHAEGYRTTASGTYSHAEGDYTKANGEYSHVEGCLTSGTSNYSHAEGLLSLASGYAAHAEGERTISSAEKSHAEGAYTVASGNYSHAEGNSTSAITSYTHSEGYHTIASGESSHAEGYQTKANGSKSHTEGFQTSGTGESSHAEGQETNAIGGNSHAEGQQTIASGYSSHAEGYQAKANGDQSHAEGSYTETRNYSEHASGYFNLSNTGSTTADKTLFSVGNGNSTTRHNAFEIRQNGDIYITSGNSEIKLQDNLGGNITVDQVLDDTTSASTNPVSSKAVYDAVTDNELVWTNAFVALSGITSAHTANTDIHVTAADKARWDSSSDSLWVSGTGVSAIVQKDGTNTASGKLAVAMGSGTTASGDYSVTEGLNTTASGNSSHAEGGYTKANGLYSHAEGYSTSATSQSSHAEGYQTTASGNYGSHAEGNYTKAIGNYSHAEGNGTTASGNYGSHAEGSSTTASGESSHAEGSSTSAMSPYSHAEGINTFTTGYGSEHAEGNSTSGIVASHAEGNYTLAAIYSHAEGYGTSATNYSHSEGYYTSANNYSHAEGSYTEANGNYSHAEGYMSSATTYYSHAEGSSTVASGQSSHAEGSYTEANGNYSHAEGYYTIASGYSSHAEGTRTSAMTYCSHTEGLYTITNNISEHASGQYNVSNSASTTFGDSGNTLFSVGNGTGDNARHNAFEIRQNGDIYINKGGNTVLLQNEIGVTVDQVIDSGTSASTNAVSTAAVYNKLGSGFTSSSVTEVIESNERVIAASLNDLDDRKADTSAVTSAITDALETLTLASSAVTSMAGYAMAASGTPITSADTLNQAIGKLEKMIDEFKAYIEQKELAIAAAITDLESRVTALES